MEYDSESTVLHGQRDERDQTEGDSEETRRCRDSGRTHL